MGNQSSERQEELWVPAHELPRPVSHPFYERLNRILAKARFDAFVEERCRKYYAETMGRPGLSPGVYFRMLLIGYFEGIDSERGIAWRCEDSMGLRKFLRYSITQSTPDHSTLSRTRRLMDLETHREVFTCVLQILVDRNLMKGKSLGVDATTLEANAAMKSIVRRSTKESYQQYLTRLAKASGIETPSREELANFDRKREKTTSNKDWENPHDPDAKITKMKDGTTHLAYKAEHVVDMDTGAILAAEIHPGSEGDTTTGIKTLAQAAEQIEQVQIEQVKREEVPAAAKIDTTTDKGYHSDATLMAMEEAGFRTYISEPQRGRRRWKGKNAKAEQRALYANRRRIHGDSGKRLLRRRGELVERSFAHCLETGRMRRVYLRGRENVAKRYLVHVAAFNLSLVMRTIFGVGTPRSLTALLIRLLRLFMAPWKALLAGTIPSTGIGGEMECGANLYSAA